MFRGEIQDIVDTGSVVRVTIDAGVPFIAAITKRSFDDLHLKKGTIVNLTFKATAVHLF